MKSKQENTRNDTRGTHPDFLNVGMHMGYAVRAYMHTYTQHTLSVKVRTVAGINLYLPPCQRRGLLFTAMNIAMTG